ncbi:hypothetical protein [Streptomyces hesseae]|uniref:Uncharacterized protein n=1 Tax=Streptomyces hesseae TaxID=3075519 RepID=A0ABU2SSS9_9ACTN|nr:hypothetical protein [Streptomyces sp. DSM 40473]MDT0452063.1 hypothetical protein [Streptomyces sp. DSM 40473]
MELLIVLDGTDEGVAAVTEALDQSQAAVTSVFDPVILMADGTDETITALNQLGQGVRALSTDAPLDIAPLGLDEDSALVASAWNLRFDPDYQSAKAARPRDGDDWDTSDGCALLDEEDSS